MSGEKSIAASISSMEEVRSMGLIITIYTTKSWIRLHERMMHHRRVLLRTEINDDTCELHCAPEKVERFCWYL